MLRRMGRCAAGGAFAATFLIAAACFAETPDHGWKICANAHAPPDQRISACTAFMKSGLRLKQGATYLPYLFRGNAYDATGEFKRSIRDFDHAMRLSPDNAYIYVDRALTYEDQGMFAQALKDFSEAVRLQPNNPDMYQDRADLYVALGKLEQAARDYGQIIRLDPDNADYYSSRARIYLITEQYRRALSDLDQAVRLKPSNPELRLERGSVYTHFGQDDKALADFDQAIRLKPNFADAYVYRGFVRVDKGHYADAMRDYDTAIHLEPGLAPAYEMRGKAFYNQSHFTHALDDFQHADILYQQVIARTRNKFDIIHDAEVLIWRYLAQSRLGQDGAGQLASGAAFLKIEAWPEPVIAFYLGHGTIEQMRRAANKPSEKCEAFFYAGEWYAAHGEKAKAKDPLLRAALTCYGSLDERAGAIAELRRLH